MAKMYTPTPEDAVKIIACLKDPTYTLEHIAADVGAPVGAIRNIVTLLKKQGIQIPRRRKVSSPLGTGVNWVGLATQHGIPITPGEPVG